MTLIANVFLNYGRRKMWLDKCLKSSVSLYPLTSNIGNDPKHCPSLNGTALQYLLITAKVI